MKTIRSAVEIRDRAIRTLVLFLSALTSVAIAEAPNRSDSESISRVAADKTQATDWPSVGRTYSENRFSPLTDINDRSVKRLGLAWSLDLPNEGALQGTPLAVDGVLYFSGSNGRAYAVEGRTGRKLWEFDPDLARHWKNTKGFAYGGNRGLAYWGGKVYVGTVDGRLVALEARTGHVAWSVNTFEAPTLPKSSLGAPRVCKGKVIIGFRGSSGARGYVSAYDAESGRKRWRFYSVPGNPVLGFENAQMAMAAKTWSGRWWEAGGGGGIWDGITCDPEFGRVYVGTSDGFVAGKQPSSTGDMLFTSSIIALGAETGAYAWHLQLNPRPITEYDAASQMILAELTLDGEARKVLMQAPKNGFFYVIDRRTGKLISAEKYEKVTWAERIDLKTGRPVEAPRLREAGATLEIWPSGLGAHSWQGVAFNAKTGLVYFPTTRWGWRFGPQFSFIDRSAQHPDEGTGALIAWDPSTQRKRWEVRYVDSFWNGGALTTGGNLVFQGTGKGEFLAYNASTGDKLWSFNAGVGIIAAPMTYEAGGVQFVSVLVGYGIPAAVPALFGEHGWHFNEQPRRLLTFSLDAKQSLPSTPPPRFTVNAVDDSSILVDPGRASIGARAFAAHRCFECHGINLENFGAVAPDLRESRLALSWDAFRTVVHDGALVSLGMPKFQEIGDEDLRSIYMYIRQQAREAASSVHERSSPDPQQIESGR